jgi:glycosyl transferase family 2/methyltransferase family protein
MIFPLSPYSTTLRYFHQSVNQSFHFLVPEGKSLLYYGRYIPGSLPELKSSRCVVVSHDLPAGNLPASGKEQIQFVHSAYDAYKPEGTFDYIILNGALGESHDICNLLKNLGSACTPATRLIIYQHNYLWQGIINLAERLRVIQKGTIQNWISVRDLKSFLNGMGFQVLRTFRQTLCPVKMGCLGPLLNSLAAIIPLFDFCKLDQYILARPMALPQPEEMTAPSLSVVLTVRDERDNIAPIVTSLPQICPDQEILFVEGHSQDGTREEIERVMALYPEKNIRVMIQPGKGQGDAIRSGFKSARGDIIILYEGDGTSTPGDIQFFYDALCSGRFEFVEGSRFIYPFDNRSMPVLNKAGNIFFARWFSWFLGQHTTDVLSGIKAITRKEFETIYAHWGFMGLDDPFGDFELLYGAFRFGLNFCEIPMHYRPRFYGVSKSRVFHHGFYLLRMAARGYWMFRSTTVHKGKINRGGASLP